jgi:superfamily II DNA or RNA helicase
VTVRLRAWQRHALEDWGQRHERDYLAVATPGSGKTTFALTCALSHLSHRPHRRVIVVAPTRHLTGQWADAAARLGLQLEPDWSPRSGRLPPDAHGAVVTYQQVATAPTGIARAAPGAFVVCDEIHHAGADRSWGEALATAFADAERRLALSGTPFRSDPTPIPFVCYEDDEAVPDFCYGYAEALADGGVVRPVRFPRVDGHMEWRDGEGTSWEATFAEPLTHQRANQRLRTALSLDGDWLPTVLEAADAKLRAVRHDHPGAAGLVIARDQEHARGIATLLWQRCGRRAAVAVSDDPTASQRIADFAGSDQAWLVAVRMVSEGVDIPRLRVGVFATTTTTELFFRQAVGRLVRWTPGLSEQTAWLYVPADPRLAAMADRIAQERRHQLSRRGSQEGGDGDGDESESEAALAADRDAKGEDRAQLSLFTALSAVPLGEPADGSASPAPRGGDRPGDDRPGEDRAALAPGPVEPEAAELTLLAPPQPGENGGRPAPTAHAGEDAGAGKRAATPEPAGQSSVAEHKRALRRANTDRAKLIAARSGLAYAQVNRELNQRARITSVGQATAEQLAARLAAADAWLQRL